MKVVDARFVTSAVTAAGIPADGVPHVVLVGRSNVGKSTLINALVGRPLARTSAAPGKTRLANLYLATVAGGGGAPGQWRVYFADLPGYGYARGGEPSVAELGQVAAEYFSAALAAGRPFRPGDKGDPIGRVFRPGDKGGPIGRVFRPGDKGGPVGRVFRPGDKGGPVGRVFRPGDNMRIAAVLHLVDARHPGLEADLDAHRWIAALDVSRALVATKIDKLSRAERARNLTELERTFGTAVLPVSAARGEGLDDLWSLIARLART